MRTAVLVLGLLMSWVASAQTAWQTGADSKGLPYAYTVNDSSNVFGQWCDDELDSCFWVLAVITGCEQNAQIPALVNAEAGAVHVTLNCTKTVTLGGKLYYRYIVAPFDDIDKVVRSGQKISIVMPLVGDEFRAYRFSLAGSSPAMAWLTTAKDRYARNKTRNTTRDTKL